MMRPEWIRLLRLTLLGLPGDREQAIATAISLAYVELMHEPDTAPIRRTRQFLVEAQRHADAALAARRAAPTTERDHA